LGTNDRDRTTRKAGSRLKKIAEGAIRPLREIDIVGRAEGKDLEKKL